MSALQDYINSKKKLGTTTGAGIGTTATAHQVNQNWLDNDATKTQPKTVAQSNTATPTVTSTTVTPVHVAQTIPVTPTTTKPSTSMPITEQWAQVLGKTPEEKATEEAQLKRAAQKKEMWGHFFDGLRYLGQAAGVAQGARVAPMSDTGSYFADQYKQEKADRDALDTSSAAYRIKLYELQQQENQRKLAQQRQDEIDQERREEHKWKEEDHAGKKEGQDLTNEGKKTDNALKKGKLDNQKQEQKDAHDKAQKTINKTSSSGSKSKTRKGSVTEQLAAYAKAHGEKINWKTLKNPANKLQELKEKYESKGKTGSNVAKKSQDPNLLKP